MLTLEQLYKLGVNIGIDIFSGLTLPEDSPFDRDIMINTIIEKCGLNIPMYSDPATMYNAVALWSARHQYTFKHLAKIYLADYSPIENKNYTESVTVDRERELTDDTTGENSSTESTSTQSAGQVAENKTSSHSGTDTTRDHNNTSAYNADDYQPENESITTIEHGEVISDSGTGSTNNSSNIEKEISGENTIGKTVNENESTTTTNTGHGNIGITSNVALQREEKDWLMTFECYQTISSIFENELTLFVY